MYFVVYVFLQSMRSTLIPSISIIVSLIGTFAFLYAAGFSLNMLTLFALVLVIGTVVDDAIVVGLRLYRLNSMRDINLPIWQPSMQWEV